ncbi:basic proline-rich protein-like isoform X3 [Gallus gallus]|uniref:basic proline-rich protein-like isoform X3 n=1 Tax=Gallus gallus TaxID=9031 RepID=UPI001AE1AD8D|nr:basic proline-rich protein-like isoform X3 [Gallus gallus]
MHVRAALLRFSSAPLGGGCLSSPISYTQRPTRPPPHPPGPGPAGHSLPRPAVSSRRSRSSSSRAAAAAPGPSSSPPPPPPRSPRSPRAEEGAAEGGRTGPSSSGGGTRTNSAPRGSARPAGRLPSLRSSPPPLPPPPPPRPRALPASARTSPRPARRGRRAATRPAPPPPGNRPTTARGGGGRGGAEPLVTPGVTAILGPALRGSSRLREDKDRHLSSPADGKVLSKPDTGCSPQWPPKEEGEGAGLQVGSQSCPLQGKSKEASVLMRLRMGCYRYISHYIYCSTKTRNGVLLVSEDTQIL